MTCNQEGKALPIRQRRESMEREGDGAGKASEAQRVGKSSAGHASKQDTEDMCKPHR